MLGDNIKRIREEKGMDAKVLASNAGITPAYLSLLESNKRINPTRKVILKIANALNVSYLKLTASDEDLKDQIYLDEIFPEAFKDRNGKSIFESANENYKCHDMKNKDMSESDDEPLTEDEKAAVKAFLDTYRKMKKMSN